MARARSTKGSRQPGVRQLAGSEQVPIGGAQPPALDQPSQTRHGALSVVLDCNGARWRQRLLQVAHGERKQQPIDMRHARLTWRLALYKPPRLIMQPERHLPAAQARPPPVGDKMIIEPLLTPVFISPETLEPGRMAAGGWIWRYASVYGIFPSCDFHFRAFRLQMAEASAALSETGYLG
jgi:hypothetical protein